MLKSKKGIYILLPLVVFIWGAILYQVLDAFSDDDPVITNTTDIKFSEIKTVERQQFEIGAVERDPFLGTLYRPKKEVAKKPVIIKKNPITWPSIRYKGLVSGQGGSKAIFLVEINGADQLLERNQSFSEIKLVKGSSVSILLRYKGESKQFKILN